MPRAAITTPGILTVFRATQLPPLARLLVAAAMTVTHWDDRRQTRKALAKLDNRLLDDIGLTEDKRLVEAEKPFWRD